MRPSSDWPSWATTSGRDAASAFFKAASVGMVGVVGECLSTGDGYAFVRFLMLLVAAQCRSCVVVAGVLHASGPVSEVVMIWPLAMMLRCLKGASKRSGSIGFFPESWRRGTDAAGSSTPIGRPIGRRSGPLALTSNPFTSVCPCDSRTLWLAAGCL